MRDMRSHGRGGFSLCSWRKAVHIAMDGGGKSTSVVFEDVLCSHSETMSAPPQRPFHSRLDIKGLDAHAS